MWRQQAQQQQQQQSQDVPSVKVNRSATSCSSGSILGSWTQLQEWAHTPVEDPLANGGKEGPVWVLKFSLDGRYLASGGQDGVVRVWCLASDPVSESGKENSAPSSTGSGTHTPMRKVTLHNRAATADEATMGSSKVVPLRGKTDLTLSLKRSFEKKFPKLGVFVKMFHPTPFLVLEGHAAAITDLTWSPSHLFLLSSSLDGSVRLWSISSNDCLCSFEHDEAVTSVTFHPLEHHLFLSGCFDGRIRLWTLFDKRVLAWNEVINNSLTAVSFNSEGTMAIAGTMTGDLLFYDVPNLKYETQINLVAQLKSMLSGKTKHTCKVTCIEPMISFREGEEDRIIVSSTDSRIRIINLRDKSVFQAFKGHTSHNTFFRGVLSEDGRYLASPSDDKTVCFWEASKGLEEGMATPSPFATSFRASSDKMTGPDKLLFDDPVTCATFAPSQLMYWKNSFEMTNRLQFSASFNADPFIIIATGDSQGQISIYRNEESASNSSIRSMKEFPTLMTPTSSGLPEFTERRSRRSSFSNVVEAAMSRASSVTPTKELKPPGILQKNQSASQLPSGKELGSAFLRSPGSALTSNSPFVTAIQEEVDDGSVIRLALPPFSRNRHYSS